MPQVESFLTLESQLQRQGRAAFRSTMGEISTRLQELVVERSFSDADKATQLLTFEPAVNQIRSRLDSHFLQTMLFGAGMFHDTVAEASFFKDRRVPEEVGLAAEQFVSVMEDSTTSLQREVRLVLGIIQARLRGELEEDVSDGDVPFFTVQKIADSELAELINATVMGTGEGLFDIGANLTTSRLASLGFLEEAKASNVKTFQITEILDEKICPVCRGFHGKRFNVDIARSRLLQQLALKGAELKAVAPFPSASRAGLKRLAKMTKSEFQKRGWDTPPFHPRCRGILVRVGTVPKNEIAGFKRFNR